MPWSIAGKISAPHGFWDEGGSAERAVYYAVCPSVPAAVSSAVGRGFSLARYRMLLLLWRPTLLGRPQSLVTRVFCVPYRRSCRPRP
jgi:hypothetical protein